MCGIAGAVGPGHALGRDAHLVLRHRGPDGDSRWWSDLQQVSLGHTRLAVIDLNPRSNQPMVSRDGLVSLVFNGEIYNFRELRAQLAGVGERFETEGDTEVLLKGYERWGEAILPRLRGMFAFAIWDGR